MSSPTPMASPPFLNCTIDIHNVIASFLTIADVARLASLSRACYQIFQPIVYSKDARATKQRALLWWAERGDLALAEKAVSALGPSLPVPKGGTFDRDPFAVACHHGHKDVARMLLRTLGRQRIDVNGKDNYGQTPISLASFAGHLNVVKFLLGIEGLDPEPIDDSGRSAFSHAAQAGHVEVVRLLLDTGKVDPDLCDRDGWTPVYFAVGADRLEMVKFLFATGKVNKAMRCPDTNDSNLLHWAAWRGLKTMLAYLLAEEGTPHPNEATSRLQTPLFSAVIHGHADVVELLLSVDDVDPDAKDFTFSTPLCHAAAEGHLEIAKMLVDTGRVDVKHTNDRGNDPLALAMQYLHYEVASFLATCYGDDEFDNDDDKDAPVVVN